MATTATDTDAPATQADPAGAATPTAGSLTPERGLRMPNKNLPISSPHQYADEFVQLGVDNADRDGVIRLRAAGGGCGTVIDLSVLGAQRLSTMLAASIRTAISRGL